MKITHYTRSANGYTLIELTVAIVIGLTTGTAALSLMSNQLQTFKILKQQNFLVTEAPQINNTLNRIISRANYFRMYGNFADATNSANSVTALGTTLVLEFQSSTNTANSGNLLPPSYGVIHFNPATNSLDYYTAANAIALANLVEAAPSWNITKQATGVAYFIQNGVLRLTINGSNGESITYSSTTLK